MYPHEPPATPETVGMDSRKLERVVRRFQKQHEAGAFPGGQLAVRRRGVLVLDLALGDARKFQGQDPAVPVRADTPFPVLSAGKPLAAMCIALLEDRGLLDVEAPIAKIFPEFARNGKAQITTLDVLTHRSGLLMPDFVRQTHLWNDRHAIQNALVETAPTYPRGTLAYHPHEYGWILSEIVQRLDGRSLPDFFAGELADPLGLPALRYGLAGRDNQSLAYNYWLGKPNLVLAGADVAANFDWQNSPEFFAANNPAVSLVTDAASLAAFYGFLLSGGLTPGGKRLISAGTVGKYTTRQVFAWDRTLRAPVALGRGFVLGTRGPSNFGWWNGGVCFGHAGGFSCLAFGDHRTGLAVAIFTNGNKSMSDQLLRFVPLADGLRRICQE